MWRGGDKTCPCQKASVIHSILFSTGQVDREPEGNHSAAQAQNRSVRDHPIRPSGSVLHATVWGNCINSSKPFTQYPNVASFALWSSRSRLSGSSLIRLALPYYGQCAPRACRGIGLLLHWFPVIDGILSSITYKVSLAPTLLGTSTLLT